MLNLRFDGFGASRKMRFFRVLSFMFLGLSLAGCDAIYHSSKVVEGQVGDLNVEVIEMSDATISQANKSAYEPKRLPAVFSATAGTGGARRGIGAVPKGPFDAPQKQSVIPVRLPPDPDPAPYAIGVGDVVLLSTPKGGSTVQELSGLLAAQNARQGYTVQDDGSINIPNVGRAKIAGLTIINAEARLFG